jgi:hypothetical protein
MLDVVLDRHGPAGLAMTVCLSLRRGASDAAIQGFAWP